jgi:hypothetical protein
MTSIDYSMKNGVYICEKCNFNAVKKSNFERHLETKKHKMTTMTTEKMPKVYECNFCGKVFKDRSNCWRHKSTCNKTAPKKSADTDLLLQMEKNDKLVEMIENILKENNEFKKLLLEQNNKLIELAKIPKTHNETINYNPKFNMNIFLNEQCKNALNMSEFVNSIQLGLDDLEYTGEVGYAEGISKIFINGLNNLDIYKRPIHCSDVKRETLYIKDENEWKKDRDKLTSYIKVVADKNIKQITAWQKEHPEFEDYSSKVNDKYINIVNNSMVGYNTDEIQKNYEKIIKNIAKETIIDKVE